MSARRSSTYSSRTRWVAVLPALVACSGAPRPDPTLARLESMSRGAVAREVQRDAPEAYAEFARVVADTRAHGAGESPGDDAVYAELVLSWAQTQAQVARARARVAEAERRRAALEQQTARLEQTAQEHERVAEQVRTAREGAAQARANSAAMASDAGVRAATAAELRQQAGLVLAAAELLGASGDALRAAREALTQAESLASEGSAAPVTGAPRGRPRAPAPDRRDVNAVLTASGRALVVAESVLRAARATRPSSQPAGPDAAQLVSDVSNAGGFDPRRDSRGVVLVMRGLFDRSGTALSAAGRGRIATAARILAQQPTVPVRVESFVGGPDRARAEARALAQSRAVVDALAHEGIAASRLTPVGAARIAPGSRVDDAVELVLVLATEP